MIDVVLTVMISAFALSQPGHASITTNDLAPPPGLSNGATSSTQQRPSSSPKATQNATKGKASKSSPETKQEAGDKAEASNGATVATAPTGTEVAQPTSDEKQAPTTKQASSSASTGPVAAFWFILPNRPPANK